MITTTKTMRFQVTFEVYPNSPCHGVYWGEAIMFGRTVATIDSCHSEKEVIAKLTSKIKR